MTRADVESASRSIAQSLGIPVIDLSLRPDENSGAFELLGSGRRRAVSAELVPSADDDAFILFTSSTTSQSKMVPLTHANVCRSAFNASAVLQLGPRDRSLNVLPLSHAHGLIFGLLAPLVAGSAVVCKRKGTRRHEEIRADSRSKCAADYGFVGRLDLQPARARHHWLGQYEVPPTRAKRQNCGRWLRRPVG